MKNRVRRNRRGIAIELALSMMVIVFGLCALMTTVVVYSRSQSRRANTRFETYAAVDALGEQFVNAQKEGKAFSYAGTEFVCDTSVSNTLTVSKDGKTLLTVVTDGSGNVKSWAH